MKCSSRSTTCLGSALLVAFVLTIAPARAQVDDPDAPVRLAVVTAVRERMGPTAVVRLEDVHLDPPGPVASGELTAVIQPGARLGRPTRFFVTSLRADGRPAGRPVTVSATVFVSIPHVRAIQAIPRGSVLVDTDLAIQTDELGQPPLPMVPVPGPLDVVGCRAVRNLSAGELVTAALIRTQPLVKAGDTVKTLVRLGRVEAVGQAIAQQSGGRHDRIRLINPESRRPLFGRITGPGEVEVINDP